jgi:hypothetical protein
MLAVQQKLVAVTTLLLRGMPSTIQVISAMENAQYAES